MNRIASQLVLALVCGAISQVGNMRSPYIFLAVFMAFGAALEVYLIRGNALPEPQIRRG